LCGRRASASSAAGARVTNSHCCLLRWNSSGLRGLRRPWAAAASLFLPTSVPIAASHLSGLAAALAAARKFAAPGAAAANSSAAPASHPIAEVGASVRVAWQGRAGQGGQHAKVYTRGASAASPRCHVGCRVKVWRHASPSLIWKEHWPCSKGVIHVLHGGHAGRRVHNVLRVLGHGGEAVRHGRRGGGGG
jgi:hypothetical protein